MKMIVRTFLASTLIMPNLARAAAPSALDIRTAAERALADMQNRPSEGIRELLAELAKMDAIEANNADQIKKLRAAKALAHGALSEEGDRARDQAQILRRDLPLTLDGVSNEGIMSLANALARAGETTPFVRLNLTPRHSARLHVDVSDFAQASNRDGSVIIVNTFSLKTIRIALEEQLRVLSSLSHGFFAPDLALRSIESEKGAETIRLSLNSIFSRLDVTERVRFANEALNLYSIVEQVAHSRGLGQSGDSDMHRNITRLIAGRWVNPLSGEAPSRMSIWTKLQWVSSKEFARIESKLETAKTELETAEAAAKQAEAAIDAIRSRAHVELAALIERDQARIDKLAKTLSQPDSVTQLRDTKTEKEAAERAMTVVEHATQAHLRTVVLEAFVNERARTGVEIGHGSDQIGAEEFLGKLKGLTELEIQLVVREAFSRAVRKLAPEGGGLFNKAKIPAIGKSDFETFLEKAKSSAIGVRRSAPPAGDVLTQTDSDQLKAFLKDDANRAALQDALNADARARRALEQRATGREVKVEDTVQRTLRTK